MDRASHDTLVRASGDKVNVGATMVHTIGVTHGLFFVKSVSTRWEHKIADADIQLACDQLLEHEWKIHL